VADAEADVPDDGAHPRPSEPYDLHFRQHYALSTSDDPARLWFIRGKDML
jgi:hypothetical protein